MKRAGTTENFNCRVYTRCKCVRQVRSVYWAYKGRRRIHYLPSFSAQRTIMSTPKSQTDSNSEATLLDFDAKPLVEEESAFSQKDITETDASLFVR